MAKDSRIGGANAEGGNGDGGSAGGQADFDIVESQRAIISTLLEVVQRMQDNDVLCDEYLHIATRGMLRARAERCEQILRQRKRNSDVISRLLQDIGPLS